MRLLPTLAAIVGLLVVPQQAQAQELGRVTVLASEAGYPEGPLWHDDALFYAEMTRDRVMRHAERNASVFWHQPGCGPTSIAPYGGAEASEGFLVLCHLGARLAVLDSQGGFQRWIESDDAGDSLSNPNDSGADGSGGVYFSDPGRFAPQPEPEGRVLYLSADGSVTRVAEHLRYANGVTVDRRGRRLLVSEHIGKRIWEYPIRGPGLLGPGRILLDLRRYLSEEELADPLAGPDGLELDATGRLFFAVYGTGRLMMRDTDGAVATMVALPEPFITNLSIDKTKRQIAVTASSDNRTPPYPGRVLLLPLPPD